MKNQNRKPQTVVGTDEQGVFIVCRPKLKPAELLILFLLFLALFSNGQTTQTQCKAITAKKERCKGIALKGGEYCVFHAPALKCEGITANGEPCKAMKVKGTHFCRFHQNQAK